uniref:TPD52 like 1 n=1 Tax=Malurus cyaneus samueli TaxID=2593467 RepID=A0A8C5T4S3_9PASS
LEFSKNNTFLFSPCFPQLEDEISTLRQVLAAKEKHLVEIKQKLGISLMNELKQNFSKSWHDMQTTSAYKKTHETLSHAGQKATAAISNVGTAISKKFGDMRYQHLLLLWNSPTFKSFEEKVETTVTSLKVKLRGRVAWLCMLKCDNLVVPIICTGICFSIKNFMLAREH